jgi:hypothetical protein
MTAAARDRVGGVLFGAALLFAVLGWSCGVEPARFASGVLMLLTVAVLHRRCET